MKYKNLITQEQQRRSAALILHYGLQPCSELSSRWFDYSSNSNTQFDKNQLGVGMKALSHLKIEAGQGCQNMAMLADDLSRTNTIELGPGSNTNKAQEPQSILANHNQAKTKLHPDPRSDSICQAHPDPRSGS